MTTPTLLELARRCKAAYPDATTNYSDIARAILAGHTTEEERNIEWVDGAVYGYVGRFYGPAGDQPGDCYTRVGVTPAGVWFVDDGDAVVRDDVYGPYWSEREAHAAACELAAGQDESDDT